MSFTKTKKSLFLMLAAFMVSTGQAFATDRLLGDANGDGRVNVADVDVIISRVLGRAVSSFDETAANVNRDARVNIADADGVLNIILTKTIGRNGKSSLLFARTSVDKTEGAAAFSVDVYRAGSTGAVTYSTNAPAVATVDSSTGVITIVGQGTATITATLAANAGLSAASATLIVNVSSSSTSSDGTSNNDGYGTPIPEGNDGWH